MVPHRYSTVAALAACLAVLFVSQPIAADVSELRMTPIVRAIRRAAPAVVNIHGHKTLKSGAADGDAGRRVNGMGTGVVVDERGYIITNHHVIDGVRRIQVTLENHRTYMARMIAHDPSTDLALIKIDNPRSMRTIDIGISSDLLTGEPVIALGNAYGYNHTCSRGIISALNRNVPVTETQHYDDLIQTDASINPGNSGGPLLNVEGKMIGINVAVRVGAQGIGFAIPVDTVMKVAARLMSIERNNQTWHGIVGGERIRDGQTSFIVRNVRKGSPAEAAGILAGDALKRVGNVNVHRALDIERALLASRAGQEVDVQVLRSGSNVSTELQVARRSQVVTRSRESFQENVWNSLGMELQPVSSNVVRDAHPQYSGGLKVARVRDGGPAAKRGIKNGDILVGMHDWETVSLDNVKYILTQADLEPNEPVKFYIVRGNQTLWGHIPIQRR